MKISPCPLEQVSLVFARIGQLEDKPHIAVACSGGGDSLALLLLCKALWRKKYTQRITALICDHAVRAESKDECQKLKETIEHRFGLAAHILSAHPFVQSFATMRGNIQQNMRYFRIATCQEWCRVNGVHHLAFGHTQDDQVETFLLQRSKKLRGSGAMHEVASARHVRIIRPLLGTTRQALRDWLCAQNISWFEDPSNRSTRYARNRLRLELAEDKKSPKEIAAILDACKRIRDANSALDKTLSHFKVQHVTLYAEGYARIDSRAFLALDDKLAQRLLSSLIQRVGGAHARATQIRHTLPIWRKKLEDFLAHYPDTRPAPSPPTNKQSVENRNKPPTLSIARTLLFANVGKGQHEQGFFITRTLLALTATPVWDGLQQNRLWDGRYRLLAPLSTTTATKFQFLQVTCNALEREGIEQVRAAAKNKNSNKNSDKARNRLARAIEILEALPARARAVCPAFWQKNQLLALPTLGIYRHHHPPAPQSSSRVALEGWLSMEECAYLPRVRWESVKQQNLHKIAMASFIV